MRATRGVSWATNTLQARPADRNLCSCRRFYVPEPVSMLLATLVQGSAGLLSAERAGFTSYGPICCGRPGLRHPPLRVLQCAMRFAVHQAVLPFHSGASGFLFGGDCRGGRNWLTWGLCIVFGAQYKRRDAPPDGRGESQHRAAPHRPGLWGGGGQGTPHNGLTLTRCNRPTTSGCSDSPQQVDCGDKPRQVNSGAKASTTGLRQHTGDR